MRVHVFGATSSPSCAGFALRQVAEDNEKVARAEVLNAIRNNFYVDDCLLSVAPTADAVELALDLQRTLASAGFPLTKYMSNCKEVLEKLSDGHLAPVLQGLDLCKDKLPGEKVLGVVWDAESDHFSVKVCVKENPLTRRGILSMAGQLYDHLGFIQPFLLPVKHLLQQLCQLKLDWDSVIPTELERVWLKWLGSLENLRSVSVPRWYKLGPGMSCAELHCFL
ncbi:uncharacterized protein LOC144744964 [Ciona intestinalis]